MRGIGYGYAHMTGLAESTGELSVCADGDATYPVAALAGVLDFLLDGGHDLVSCARYPVPPSSQSPWRLRLGVWLLNREVRLLHGCKVNDVLSGMWIVRSKWVGDLNLTRGDWNLSPEIKINALRHPTLRFAEYQISQRQRRGESHQRHVRTGVSHAWWILCDRIARGRVGRRR